MTTSTRRAFLRCAAAGAAGFTFLPRRVWGANERLDIAIIGTGNISQFHLNTLPTCGGNIVALCDVDALRGVNYYCRLATTISAGEGSAKECWSRPDRTR